jgi:preprotein translocase subunit SecY
MFKTLKEAWLNKDIRKKIFIVIGLVLLFRLGCWIPVPGINASAFSHQVEGQTFLQLLSGVTGGALSNGALLALGVSPYITAQIVVQLLSMAIPSWERLARQGEEGRKKLTKYTKILTLILALAQAIGIVVSFSKSGGINSDIFFGIEWLTCVEVVVVLTAGALFTMWLGEQITATGIANGLSLIIFIGILSSAGSSLATSIADAISGKIDSLWKIIGFVAAVIIIFGMIVMMDQAERKIPVQYAKQIKGRKMYGGQSTYIPIKLMGTGVLPIIFALSLLSFPQIVMSIFWPNSNAAIWYAKYMGVGTWPYILISCVLILFFAYFTSMMTFKPDDISKQIQSNSGFIPGIRPGRTTTEYLERINKRITFFGALFLAFLTVVPSLIFKAINPDDVNGLISAFSATGMIIIVSVALEIDKQLQAQLLMKNYKGFLK